MRPPGKHHKRDHWSEFWIGGEWYKSDDAAELLLDIDLTDANLVPRSADNTVPSKPLPEGISGHIEGATPGNAIDALQCLQKLSVERASNYDEWIRVGMVLHSIDPSPIMCAAWDAWSKRSSKWQEGTCADEWRTFTSDHENPVGLGTLIQWVEQDESEQKPQQRPSLERTEGDEIIRRLTFELGLSIERFIQRGAEAGTEQYYLKLRNRDEEIPIGNATALFSFSKFRTAVYVHTKRVVRIKNP
ncbi:hypothetical protein LCGC14_1989180, partial [marine sediment metagenome]